MTSRQKMLLALYGAVLVLVVLLGGCRATSPVRDFAKFQDTCLWDWGLRPEVCEKMWRAYSESRVPGPTFIYNGDGLRVPILQVTPNSLPLYMEPSLVPIVIER